MQAPGRSPLPCCLPSSLTEARNFPSQSLARMSWFVFGSPASSHILSAKLKLLSVDDLLRAIGPYGLQRQGLSKYSGQCRIEKFQLSQTLQMPEGQVVWITASECAWRLQPLSVTDDTQSTMRLNKSRANKHLRKVRRHRSPTQTASRTASTTDLFLSKTSSRNTASAGWICITSQDSPNFRLRPATIYWKLSRLWKAFKILLLKPELGSNWVYRRRARSTAAILFWWRRPSAGCHIRSAAASVQPWSSNDAWLHQNED